MRKTETLNLRVSSQFKRKLIGEQKKQKRSVTNYLEVTLRDFWKAKSQARKEFAKRLVGRASHLVACRGESVTTIATPKN